MRRASALLSLLVVLSLSLHARGDEADSCVTAAEESQPLRRSGKLRAARTKLLSCSRAVCPSVVSADCGKWLGEVEATMATVLLRVSDGAAQDIADARLFVDGQTVETDAEGVFFVEPGRHTLRVERSGTTPAELEITARAGERRRAVDVVLRAPTTGPTAATPPPAEDVHHVPAGAWILGAAGAVAMGAGVALWIAGRSEYSDLKGSCGQTSSCAASDVSAMKTKLQIGDIAFGAGLLALGAGLYVGLSGNGPPRAAFGVRPADHGAAVVFSASIR